MSEKEEYFTELKDGELAVRTLSQSGSIVPEEGKDPKKYVTALVETSSGKQLCLKTLDMNGGGGSATLKHRYCFVGVGSGNIGNINGAILPWQTENKPFVFEVDFRVAPLGNFTNGQGILLTGNSHYSVGFELVLDGENSSTNDNKARIGCGLTTANNSWNITWSWSDYVFEPMKWYTFRLSYDLTNYTLEFKKKGDSTWTQLGQFANSTKLYYASNSNLYIGAQSSSSNVTPLWKGALVDINSFKATNGNEVYFNGLDSLANYLTLNTLNISEFYEP